MSLSFAEQCGALSKGFSLTKYLTTKELVWSTVYNSILQALAIPVIVKSFASKIHITMFRQSVDTSAKSFQLTFLIKLTVKLLADSQHSCIHWKYDGNGSLSSKLSDFFCQDENIRPKIADATPEMPG